MLALSSPLILLWTLILASLNISTYAHPLTAAQLAQRTSSEVSHGSQLFARANICRNAIQNASFKSPTVDPWIVYVSGSWESRGIIPGAAHSEAYFYHAVSNSTSSSTIVLSQPFSIPATTVLECSAWMLAGGDIGSKGNVRFEIFLDGMSCGSRVLYGGEKWVKIGTKLQAVGGTHMVALVAVADAGGEMDTAIEVGVDEVWVGQAC